MVSKIKPTLPYQDHDFLKLPKDILINIFNKAISDITDIARLSLVCRGFKGLLEDDRIWQVLANKKGYRKIDGLSHRDCCLIVEREIKKVSNLIDKIKYPNNCQKVSALIRLLKINFSEELSKTVEDQMKQIQPRKLFREPRQRKLIRTYLQLGKVEKAQNVIEQSAYFHKSDLVSFTTNYKKGKPTDKDYSGLKSMINEGDKEGTHTFCGDEYVLMITRSAQARIKLIWVCLQLNKIPEANDLFEKITNPFMKILAQIHFLKANPSKEALEKIMAEIKKIPDNPLGDAIDRHFYKAIAKIKLLKVFFRIH